MKTNVWVVIVVVAAFLGFMMGYSVPPMIEVGYLGGEGEAGVQSEVDEELDAYYRALQEQDE